jgi:hypothetical protein
MKTRVIQQNKMTGECWLIQMSGPKTCETCEAKGKRDCGGKKIRKTGKNEKGFAVPL